MKNNKSRSQIFKGQTYNRLAPLVRAGRKFGCIYADPPWPFRNQRTRGATRSHYPSMTLDEIRAEPVAALAADRAHLHLWTTNAFLAEALQLIETWGFTYKSAFSWVKPQMGLGNYWRSSHELLLLGVRGSLVFLDHSQRSWVEAPRTKHSCKPEVIRQRIEKVSPGPFLEMYARQPPPNSQWTVYGNQIESMAMNSSTASN